LLLDASWPLISGYEFFKKKLGKPNLFWEKMQKSQISVYHKKGPQPHYLKRMICGHKNICFPTYFAVLSG